MQKQILANSGDITIYMCTVHLRNSRKEVWYRNKHGIICPGVRLMCSPVTKRRAVVQFHKEQQECPFRVIQVMGI